MAIKITETVPSRQAVVDLLLDHKWHSTVAINLAAGTEGTRRLRELRERGYLIEGRRIPHASQWEYRLISGGFDTEV